MIKAKRLGAAFAVLAMLALLAGPVLGAADATVGRFVQELARVKNLNATDARVAADSLRVAGIPLPAGLDLNKRLTERDVAEISRIAGLRVTTSNPDAPFTLDKIDRFFRSFGGELGMSDAATTFSEPPGFSKGKKRGSSKAKYNRTPSDPE